MGELLFIEFVTNGGKKRINLRYYPNNRIPSTLGILVYTSRSMHRSESIFGPNCNKIDYGLVNVQISPNDGGVQTDQQSNGLSL